MNSTRRNRAARITWGAVLALCVAIAILPYLPWLGAGVIPKLQAPQLYLLAVPAAVILYLLARRRWAWAMGLVPLLLLGGIVHLGVPAADTKQESRQAGLVVMSFNAYKAQADPGELADEIRTVQPDVLVLVETSETLHRNKEVAAALQELPHRTELVIEGWETDGAIFSRYPLEEREGGIPVNRTGWYAMPVATVSTLDGAFLIAGIHVHPPLGDAQKWQQGMHAMGNLAAAEQELPLILAGDFNATRGNAAYRKLASGFAEAAGAWPRASWPTDQPVGALVEIDHILVRGMDPQGYRSTRIEGSDHRAISVRMYR